mgnify:CR=1 FL=1
MPRAGGGATGAPPEEASSVGGRRATNNETKQEAKQNNKTTSETRTLEPPEHERLEQAVSVLKMLGGASQIVSTIRGICNGT